MSWCGLGPRKPKETEDTGFLTVDFDIGDARSEALEQQLNATDLAKCREVYPVPGTSKIYALGGESAKHNAQESYSTIKNPDTGADIFLVTQAWAGKCVVLRNLNGVPLIHAILRPDSTSLEIIMGGAVAAVITGISCSTAHSKPAFPWMAAREHDGVCSYADMKARIVPDETLSRTLTGEGGGAVVAAYKVVAEHLGNEDVAFKYMGDVGVTNPCSKDEAVKSSLAKSLESFGGELHSSLVSASVKSDSGLQALLIVKHRRWGEGAAGSWEDDHLVLLLATICMYNTVAEWRARLKQSIAPIEAAAAKKKKSTCSIA
ncbi:hypothetical protein CYMTET_9520 [Cymbomonas tetramitiformis]|uniref:Uncharacterized protein n=1 Tax=Cymbomonas tetramitiformis TaxID=36881 RepID=A0AAE0LFD7_9CHLO|nr:hypothetical protein CYMTET_9520 [Cymbomonas tetramitiformis]